MSHLRKSGSSHGSLHERKAQSTSACQRLSLSRKPPDAKASRARRISAMPDLLGEKMRRDQHQPAHAVILHAAGIDGGDRGAVAVAEQKTALKADCREHARQHFAGLLMHEGGRARQFAGTRLAVAGARIDKHAGAGRRRDLIGKRSPQADAAEALVQHHDGRRRVGPRPDHAVFEPQRRQIEKALVGKRHGCNPACSPSSCVTTPQKLGKALLHGVARRVDLGFGAGIVGAARFEDRDQIGHRL